MQSLVFVRLIFIYPTRFQFASLFQATRRVVQDLHISVIQSCFDRTSLQKPATCYRILETTFKEFYLNSDVLLYQLRRLVNNEVQCTEVMKLVYKFSSLLFCEQEALFTMALLAAT